MHRTEEVRKERCAYRNRSNLKVEKPSISFANLISGYPEWSHIRHGLTKVGELKGFIQVSVGGGWTCASLTITLVCSRKDSKDRDNEIIPSSSNSRFKGLRSPSLVAWILYLNSGNMEKGRR